MDLQERLTETNLLAPLEFPIAAEAQIFVRDNCCVCGANLVYFASGDHYEIKCLYCGPTYKHNHVSKYQMEQADQGILAAERELRTRTSKRSVDEILADLGY